MKNYTPIYHGGQPVQGLVKDSREERNIKLAHLYTNLRAENPAAKRFTLCRAITCIVDYAITAQTVYAILKRNGKL